MKSFKQFNEEILQDGTKKVYRGLKQHLPYLIKNLSPTHKDENFSHYEIKYVIYENVFYMADAMLLIHNDIIEIIENNSKNFSLDKIQAEGMIRFKINKDQQFFDFYNNTFTSKIYDFINLLEKLGFIRIDLKSYVVR